ncbi:GNAT family N-acetyltransferase [Alkaliphilus serpentinus]|uniref:GNAT family N-acetyltransferase n=1 Tax=Alkaliphilus serpentinus TaxID=1482731 RepID=A0A833MCL6_9FIRM|nr:GNAT family N-acetyltransferase [Alkaliphilus serpentinus]KAB3525677.1 GNAT family N-acetyltransferase [Alkaliphilus serpentinus]
MDLANLNSKSNDALLPPLSEKVKVRRATPKDLHDIYQIACSVGKSRKDSKQGFLVDDYSSNPKFYQKYILEKIFELNHFYVAEYYGKLLGFLMAYTKDQWLKYNENWLEDIYWHPEFNLTKINSFVLVDKTAILSHLTGQGIGSKLYQYLTNNLYEDGIMNILAETVISPQPNLASLAFRDKQKYKLVGIRYEDYNNQILTDLIYHKSV